ncbi:hypothetical protein BBIA_1660 [Bifidobacterium biavatii DSM 23969]|uniref:Uncharacterized protein n=1 Tax=Bifidobacterium biavatii DSM 23969 TaxID=1437608 RepID=A0A086ZUH8_9BIFI|nr:hypothetical protein BBIA_1660 [Bifidobacterium biavatii DSM 23969]
MRIDRVQEVWDGGSYLGLAYRLNPDGGLAGEWTAYVYVGDRKAAKDLDRFERRDLSHDYVDCGICEGLSLAFSRIESMSRTVLPVATLRTPETDIPAARIACPNCARGFLERGQDVYAGMFTCPSCHHSFGVMPLAVVLLNEGRAMEDVAAATGLTCASIRANLRYNYRRVGTGADTKWVDRGSVLPSVRVDGVPVRSLSDSLSGNSPARRGELAGTCLGSNGPD